MNTRIEYALAWKELRQSLPVLIAFCLLSLFYVSWALYIYTFELNPNANRMAQIRDALLYFAFIISLGLTYLFACGNRVLEAGDNLEAFLFTRPVDRNTLIKVYYTISLTQVLIWIAFTLLLVYFLFGMEALQDPGSKSNLFGSGFALFLFWLLSAHGLTFVASLNFPNLVVTSTIFIGSFIAIAAVTLMPRQLMEILLRSVAIFPFLILFAAAIFGAAYLYNRKQLS